MIVVLVVVSMTDVVLVINVIVTGNTWGNDDSGAGGFVSEKNDSYSKHIW